MPARIKHELALKRDLNKRIESVMYSELGLQRPLRGSDILFTAEQEQEIADAIRRFPPVRLDHADPASAALAASNRVARLEMLSQHLSTEQLRFYKLDRENDAARVQAFLKGIQPSKDEFLAVADAIEGRDTTFDSGGFRPEVANALQQALSEERFQLLQDLHRPGSPYRAIVAFGAAWRLPASTTAALVQARRNLSAQSAEAYRSNVEAIIQAPQVASKYLSDRVINNDLGK